MNVQSKSRRREGFWRQTFEELSDLPWPEPGEWSSTDRLKFLEALAVFEKKCDRLESVGYSHCRLCDFQKNGFRTFMTSHWSWPEGYRHYIEEHNVRPSPEFEALILSRTER